MPRSHPKALYLICSIDMWERFSFHGMRAMLVLFLISSFDDYGFAWSQEDAVRVYGTYIALIYLAPLICSGFVDRGLGHFRGLLFGGVAILAGHASLLLVHWTPVMFGGDGVTMLEVLKQADVPLGQIALSVDEKRRILAAGGSDAILFGYSLTSFTFHAALGLIILGTGFFKPSAASLISKLYDKKEGAQREQAFTIEYTAINIGSFAAPIIAGSVGEVFGWHYGFAVAAFGMALGLGVFVLGAKRYLPTALRERARSPASGKDEVTPQLENGRSVGSQYALLTILVFILSFYWTVYEQWGGLINIFTFEQVDRELGGGEVSATVFQSLNPLFIILFSPLIIWSLKKVDEHYGDTRITPFHKLAASFFLLGAGFLCLYAGAFDAQSSITGKTTMVWLVAAYFFIAVSELLLAPVSLALFTRIAPPAFLAVAASVFYLTNSIGAFLSGLVGAWALRDNTAVAFGILALASAAFSPLILLLVKVYFKAMTLEKTA